MTDLVVRKLDFPRKPLLSVAGWLAVAPADVLVIDHVQKPSEN
jgi:hypothetical protein